VFAPPSVLPGRGVTWRAETENVIVARFDLPPEQHEVRLQIDDHGTLSVGWWFDTPRYAPFFHAEISAVTAPL
jgi:hypothetical protein